MSSDRGASQQTFDFGDEVEPTLPANLLPQELTDPASIDTPSLSVSPDADLMEQIVDPQNLDRAWRQVKSNRGAPGPDGMTIKAFESWWPEHWPAVKQQLLDGTHRPSPVRRKTIPKDGGGERSLGIPNVLDRLIQQASTKVRNLVRLGVSLDMTIQHVVSRKSYWRLSRTPAMRYAMPNKWLEQLGLLSLKQLWCDLAPLRGTA